MDDTKKKILVKIHRPFINRLNETTRAACLNRDAYLDRVFHGEATLIPSEVPQPNSDEAKKYLRNDLKRAFDLVAVNLNLSVETVAAINTACATRNIDRDCFINRVLYTLLAANRPDFVKKKLGVPLYDLWEQLDFSDKTEAVGYSPVDGSLQIIYENVNAPSAFWAIRKCLERWNRDIEDSSQKITLLGKHFVLSSDGKRTDALNCFIDDQFVPGTQKYRDASIDGDWLNDLLID